MKKIPSYRLLFIAIISNFVEYYDYALYGFVAANLASYFFPALQDSESLLATFAVFSLGSFAKPLGAFCFARLGDKKGRRVALKGSILGMGAGSLMLALVPSYEAWGEVSLCLLILCRLSQGFFLGGEADGVRLYVMEHMREKPAFGASLSGVMSFLGIYAASVLSQFAAPLLWGQPGWKWLFAGGGLISVTLYFLRRNLLETPPFLEVKRTPYPPLFPTLRRHIRSFMAIFLLTGISGGLYHLLFVFSKTFWADLTHILPVDTSSSWTSIGILSLSFATPLVGFAADKVSKKGLIIAGVFTLISSLSLLFYDISTQAPQTLTAILLGASMALFMTPIFPYLFEDLPVKARFRITALGHTIGSMVFSGTAPLIGTLLYPLGVSVPFLYGVFLLALAAGGLFIVKTKSRN